MADERGAEKKSFRILGLKPFDVAVFLAWVGLTADSIYYERYAYAAGEFLIGGLYFLWRGLTKPDVEKKHDDEDDDDDTDGGIKDRIPAPVRT